MAGVVHCMSRTPHPPSVGPRPPEVAVAMLLCGVAYYTLPVWDRYVHQDLVEAHNQITCEACKAELARLALEEC